MLLHHGLPGGRGHERVLGHEVVDLVLGEPGLASVVHDVAFVVKLEALQAAGVFHDGDEVISVGRGALEARQRHDHLLDLAQGLGFLAEGEHLVEEFTLQGVARHRLGDLGDHAAEDDGVDVAGIGLAGLDVVEGVALTRHVGKLGDELVFGLLVGGGILIGGAGRLLCRGHARCLDRTVGRVIVDACLRGPAGTLRELLDGSLGALLAGGLVGSRALRGLAGLALPLLGKLGSLAGGGLFGGFLDGVSSLD